MTENSKQSSGYVPGDVDDRGKWRESLAPPAPARSAALVIAGVAMAVAITAIVWLGFDALWPLVAGEPNEETARYGRGLIYGSGSLTSTLLLTRSGIVSIPRNLPQIDLTDNFYRTYDLILLLLQFFGELLWKWIPGS